MPNTHLTNYSITQATLLPPEETGHCPRHCAGSCQVRPSLLSVSDHKGFPSFPSEPAEFPLPQTQHKTLSSVLQANRKALCLYSQETKEKRPSAHWADHHVYHERPLTKPVPMESTGLEKCCWYHGNMWDLWLGSPSNCTLIILLGSIMCDVSCLFGSFHPSNGESPKMD